MQVMVCGARVLALAPYPNQQAPDRVARVGCPGTKRLGFVPCNLFTVETDRHPRRARTRADRLAP